MRRLWLIFAQAVTISIAVLFVLQTLKPEWLGGGQPSIVSRQEAPPLPPGPSAPRRSSASYSDAARKALPSVVHVFTSKANPAQRNPFADDPISRHFFGDRL